MVRYLIVVFKEDAVVKLLMHEKGPSVAMTNRTSNFSIVEFGFGEECLRE